MAITIVKKDQLQAEVERYLDQKTTFLGFVNMKFSSAIKSQGDTVTVQSIPNLVMTTGATAGAAIAAQNVTITGTNIVADQVDVANVPITDFEEAVSNLDLMSKFAERLAFAIKTRMEVYFFSLHTGALAANELDDGDLDTATNGGAGNPANVTVANVYEVFAKIAEKLEDQNVNLDEVGVFVRPAIKSILVRAGLASGTDIGMADGKKGLIANVAGVDIFVNNNTTTAFMIALDKEAIQGVSKYAKTDVRDNVDGFSSNLIAENIFGGKITATGSKSIATFEITNY